VRLLRGTGPYGIQHNKFAIVDHGLLEMGSFNYTTAANTLNHENALFRRDKSLIADFQTYFDWMWGQSGEVGAAPQSASGTPPVCAAGPTALGRTWPQCAFAPNGPTEDLLVDAINRSRRRIHVAMFAFTSPAVVDALVAAKDRGLDVRLVVDKSQANSQSSIVAKMRARGVNVRIGTGIGLTRGVLHHKYAIFDELLETGSFNFSINASKNNYENAFFTALPEDVAGYDQEFESLFAGAASN
jgi:phosphatidylserine/phosphatidylglycerophosphate/cardiolipin synthase-like enzyme